VNLSGILCGSLWNKQKNGNSSKPFPFSFISTEIQQIG
jgi:hypothetical protein